MGEVSRLWWRGFSQQRHAGLPAKRRIALTMSEPVASLISPRYLTRGGHKKQETRDITKRKTLYLQGKTAFYMV